VGKVYLVGAGPGDPGLLTLRGAAVLGEADVVLYDALAHPSLLEHVRPGAECKDVGKRYGEQAFSQDAINAELVALARQGKTVARLKGGDPLLFARGAEEVETLAREAIPFEIVPGIPSPTGAAAYAGISLTHRDLSSSVAFITGTEAPGKERTSHDWSKLATATQTLCVIMGMRRLDEIVRALVEHGRPSDTPVAVIQWGTWPKQRVVSATLATIVEEVNRAQTLNPAVAIIGEVARLRDTMRWFDTKPLFGKRLMIVRAREQAAGTAERVRLRGAEPVIAPAISIVPPSDPAPFEKAISNLGEYDAVAFTSANTVTRVYARLAERDLDTRAFGRALVAAIGPGTAAALRAGGIRPDVVAPEFRGEGLAEALLDALQRRPRSQTSGGQYRVLLPRALVAREALPEMLRNAGIEVDVVAAYETRPAAAAGLDAILDQLRGGRIDAVLFTASSTVTNLMEALGQGAAELLAKTTVASIGPITSATAKSLGIRVGVEAREYTIPGLLDALERHFAAARDGT
jgi:uroporphyrinogen III methyltransferase/synthase